MTHSASEMDGYHTSVATLEEFRSSREAWNKLVLSMALPSVFLTWEWLYTWWEHFGNARRELFILLVRRDGQLKGILPLFQEGGYKLVGGAYLWFCAANDLYPDHLDIIAAPQDANACLASIYRYLLNQDAGWAVVEFPMITRESAIYRWLHEKTASPEKSPDVDLSRSSVAHYIPLEGSFESYFSSLDKKQRYNVRTRRNRLYKEQAVTYAVRSPDTDCLAVLFDLHRRRAERKGIVSSFGHEEVFGFHRAFIERAAPAGWVQFRFLEGPQGAIAAAYNLVFAGRVYSYQKGIDPAWERHGPGTVLLYELVQEAFAQGLKEYNFLQGAEGYKNEWARHWRDLGTFRLYNPGPAGRFAACMYSSKRLLKKLTHRG